MRQEFFIALSGLARAAEDPEVEELALATLEYCVVELRALRDRATERRWYDTELSATTGWGSVHVVE